jgi:hypothetical protein
MNKLALAKAASTLVVGTSVGSVVRNLLKNQLTADTQLGEVQLKVGTWILGAMVAGQATDWSLSKINGLTEAWEAYQKSQEIIPETE